VATDDDVRRIALALPGVEEIPSEGFDFREIRTDVAVLYVGDEAEKQALLLGEPELFFTHPTYDGLPLVMVWLEKVGQERLEELILDAWRMRAPAELAADLQE
jgi:hypothetical protein